MGDKKVERLITQGFELIVSKKIGHVWCNTVQLRAMQCLKQIQEDSL